MEPTVVAAAVTDAVVKEALKTGTAPLVRGVSKLGKKAVDNLVVALQLGFHDYMKVSYEKCRYFKSVLPPSQPRDILAHYINAKITAGEAVIPDYALFEEPTRGRNFVITGLAGSGKSMLLKHFVASYFSAPRGPTPLFVELRRLNKFTSRDLLSFIRADCVSASNQVSEAQFDLALRNGVFCLILDGFDEVNDDFKGEVQEQILGIRRLYPELFIAVSSRPDPRFRGWSSFAVYHMKELDKDTCIQLIDSFDYDQGIKKRFRERVNKSLWDTHKSFLHYPLLVSIMLLTYEEFADIPRRKHVFYRQAFDTLFVKHDSDKEQYERQLKTGLQLEEFRSSFSAFCGLSYLKSKISFDDDALAKFSQMAAKYAVNAGDIKAEFRGDDFKSDLFNAVCMLQTDGLETTFVHRSFQEYFAAYFAIRLPSDKMMKVLDAFSERFRDQALLMAFDMSKEIVETSWALPRIDHLLSLLDDKSKTAAERFGYFSPSISLDHKDGDLSVQSIQNGAGLHTIHAIGDLYSINVKTDDIFLFLTAFEDPVIIDRILSPENGRQKHFKTLQRFREHGGARLDLPLRDDSQWWFEILGGDEFINQITSRLEKLRKTIRTRDRRADAIIDELI